jgi:hypothetical protein
MDTAVWALIATAIVLVALGGGYGWLTYGLLRRRVEPVVDFDLAFRGEELSLRNRGAWSVTDIGVDAEAITFLGPPWNEPVARVRSGQESADGTASRWWHLGRLAPGEAGTRSVNLLVDAALRQAHTIAEAKKGGNLPGIPPKDPVRPATFLVLRLSFRHEANGKRHRRLKTLYIGRDVRTGKRLLWDARQVSPGSLLEILNAFLRDGASA